MTRDISEFISFNEIGIGNVTFGNNSPTSIKGKGTVALKKGKTKAQNGFFVDGKS